MIAKEVHNYVNVLLNAVQSC